MLMRMTQLVQIFSYFGFIFNEINKLNGYYYTENKIAKQLGYNNDERQVGVSAQEVRDILPEVVTTAPIDDRYYTVYYDKLVPLLIEAIKELNNKLENK